MIPKKIWMIWCDFNNQTDGEMNETLEFYKSNVLKLHKSEWECNIIVKWKDLMDKIEDKSIKKIIENKFISAAHKSDILRFYLLTIHGGFWIDFSTFLITSLDVYYNEKNVGFLCNYTPSILVEQWIIKPLSLIFHNFNFKTNVKELEDIQKSFISLKPQYKKYPFITENFFIGSEPNHFITKKVFHELKMFWLKNIDNIESKESLCDLMNNYNHKLMTKIYNINVINNILFNLFSSEDVSKKSLLLKDLYFDCGYYFNYLQIYESLIQFIEMEKNTSITFLPKANSEYLKKSISDFKYVCDKNFCDDIFISSKKGNILLTSAMYDRSIKWSNIAENRTSLSNTFLEKKLSSFKNIQNLFKILVQNGIYQIKFSAWTRNSKIIPILMKKTKQTMKRKRKNIRKTQKK